MINIDLVREILARAKLAIGARSDAELARYLTKSRTTVSNWRQRGTLPIEALLQIARDRRVSLDWLLLGRESESVHAAGVKEAKTPYAAAGSDFGAQLRELQDLTALVREVWEEEGLEADDIKASMIVDFVARHGLDRDGIRELLRLMAGT